MPEVKVSLNSESYEAISNIAKALDTSVEAFASSLLDAVSSYTDEVIKWGLELKVKRENRIASLADEIIYYGIEAWRGVVSKVLDELKARGRFELEELDFDPHEPSMEIELVALEGSDLQADRVRINWSVNEVIVEAYYYLEEGKEPPHVPRVEGFEVSYLPDEHAILVSATSSNIKSIPPIYVFDRVATEGV